MTRRESGRVRGARWPGLGLACARRALPVHLVLLLGAAAVADAQSTDDINASLQFNFSNPGARSLGLGGAFTARADDATAVYANPAGLVQLATTEISGEAREWRYGNPFLDGGTQQTAGALEGLDFGTTDDVTRGLSFVSGVYAARSGRWVAGVFRHELANFRTDVHSDGALVRRGESLLLARPLDGVYDLQVTSQGLSVGFAFDERLSFGVTAALSRFELRSRTERLDALRTDAADPPDPRIVDADPSACCAFGNGPDEVITFQTQRTDPEKDEDFVYTLGVLWRSSRRVGGVPRFALGAVYRRGPAFGFLGNSYFRSFRDLPGGRIERSFPSQIDGPTDPEECRRPGRPGCPGVFKVPDVFGLGVSVRPAERWIVSLDYNRVEYSDLSEKTLDIVNADPRLGQGLSGPPKDFELDDGDELRLGVEYAWVRERRLPDVFLRGGAWRDPDHKLRYTGTDSARQSIWTPGSDELHFAAGLGLRYPRFQVDAAADLSDRVDTVSVSMVVYLGRS